MRKILLLSVSLLFIYLLNSQSVNQLWAPINQGGPVLNNNVGVLRSMSSKGTNLKSYLVFDSINVGSIPRYTEMVEYNGNFYGMTENGGVDSGVIFQWNPITNIVTKQIDFNIQKGSFPEGSLTLLNNKFYGLTQSQTTSGYPLFEWDPNTNVYTIKATFSGVNGESPFGGVTEYNNKLYGLTNFGGVNNAGVIFEYDISSGLYTKKFDMVSSTGRSPYGNLVLLGNKFYGMTLAGGASNNGVIFEWDPATNIYTLKFSFSGTDGSQPYSDLTYYNNKFYGVTYQGGANNAGVIFEWDPATNIYTKKVDMTTAEGRFSTSKLKLLNNKFYGFTSSGGANGVGVIFEWDPVTNIYTKKVDLTTANGSAPQGSLTTYGTKFIGLTTGGGAYNRGTIMEWDPSTNTYAKKYDFPSPSFAKGRFPVNTLAFYNGKLYGTGSAGGTSDAGVIFEYDPTTKIYLKKYDFDGTNGSTPLSKLTLKNGKFYGTTSGGGANSAGVIFEFDPSTNAFTKKYDFVNSDGATPSGNLVELNGKFYGTSRAGGSSNLGVIYEWDPVTNIYTKKIDMTAANGSTPHGSLVYYNNIFYGLTTAGGANGSGVIYQWDPATNIYTKKIDMSAANGSFARGQLVLNSNNKFYGLTRDGGTNNLGVIFEWDPATNIYTKKSDFSNTNGSNPLGSLLLSDGKFYGMTSNGGSGSRGVIFEWDAGTNAYSIKEQLSSSSIDRGWHPAFENNFISIPAPIAPGTPNVCTTVPSITIDATNNNTWIPIVDNDGNVLAEIDANGNNLGTVTTSFYINSGTVREDANHTLYLDRNFTITPQTQPSSAVDIRLYLTEAEFQALKNATNSLGQPSGVNTITDVLIYKNSDACVPAVSGTLNPVVVNAGISYNGYGYMVTASITSFSSFYLMTPSSALPLHITEFSGQLLNNDVKLKWKAFTSPDIASYTIEKSSNGRDYSGIGSVRSINTNNLETYNYTDANVTTGNASVLFYRLAERSISGAIDYSKAITIPIHRNKIGLTIYPNPINDQGTIQFSITESQNVNWKLLDITGRVLLKGTQNFSVGNCFVSINTSKLSSGVYTIQVEGDTINERIKMIKK